MRRQRPIALHSMDTEESQINITPLIDVVFVVLIMFILIAPMVELDRIQLATAATKEQKESGAFQEDQAIAIRVHADDSIWMHNQKIDKVQLLSFLRHAKRAHPEKIPQLYHDKTAHFGTYQDVKNAVEMAGFEQLDIILQP